MRMLGKKEACTSRMSKTLFAKKGKNTRNLDLEEKQKCGFRHIKCEVSIRH